MRATFLPFTLSTYSVFDVVWEQRVDVTSMYKRECAECGIHFPVEAKRSLFVLVPEGSTRNRNPFYIVTSCSNCLAVVRQKIEMQFKPISSSTRRFYVHEVGKALRVGGIKFIESV